jgi:hypothetical protein
MVKLTGCYRRAVKELLKTDLSTETISNAVYGIEILFLKSGFIPVQNAAIFRRFRQISDRRMYSKLEGAKK